MTREEFLGKLRTSLSNDFASNEVENQLSYYSEYINDEIRKGRSEQDVLDELGDPWIIARSLVNAASDQMEGYESSDSYNTYSGYEDSSSSSSGGYQSYQGRNSYETEDIGPVKRYLLEHPRVLKAVIVAAVVLAVGLVFSLIMGVFSLLAPILVPVIVVLFVVRLLRGDRFGRW